MDLGVLVQVVAVLADPVKRGEDALVVHPPALQVHVVRPLGQIQERFPGAPAPDRHGPVSAGQAGVAPGESEVRGAWASQASGGERGHGRVGQHDGRHQSDGQAVKDGLGFPCVTDPALGGVAAGGILGADGGVAGAGGRAGARPGRVGGDEVGIEDLQVK